MSTYDHFFKRVSVKCREILHDYHAIDIRCDREVTHMMALANAAIGIPFERLDLSDLSGDKNRYPEAKDTLKALLNDHYAKLFHEGVWHYGKWSGKPKEWENEVAYNSKLIEEYFKECSVPPKARDFLKHLRNAFAHGNLFFTPKSGTIEQVVFLQKDFTEQEIDSSVKKKCLDAIGTLQGKEIKELRRAIKDAVLLEEGYAFLTIKPNDFLRFLEIWFSSISNLKIEESTLKDIKGDELVLDEAAD